MYGHGDVRPDGISSNSVDLVEVVIQHCCFQLDTHAQPTPADGKMYMQDIVVEYCTTLLQKAVDQASLRGAKLQPEDILFLLRKVLCRYSVHDMEPYISQPEQRFLQLGNPTGRYCTGSAEVCQRERAACS